MNSQTVPIPDIGICVSAQDTVCVLISLLHEILLRISPAIRGSQRVIVDYRLGKVHRSRTAVINRTVDVVVVMVPK